MKTFKWLMVALITIGLFISNASLVLAAVCNTNTDIACYTVKGLLKYRIDKDGNTTFGGNETVTGNETVSGNSSVTGTLGVTGVATFGAAIVPWPRTLAQINALTAGTTDQLVVCSDCVRSPICISSGSVNPGAWVIVAATGTFVGSTHSGLQHCQ